MNQSSKSSWISYNINQIFILFKYDEQRADLVNLIRKLDDIDIGILKDRIYKLY